MFASRVDLLALRSGSRLAVDDQQCDVRRKLSTAVIGCSDEFQREKVEMPATTFGSIRAAVDVE